MKLTKQKIREILTTNPTKDLWAGAVKTSSRLQMHVLGHGLKTYLERIEQHESEKALAVRQKYCKTNRDLFARVLRPIDNIWNGRGGGVFYNTTEQNQGALRSMLLNVVHGYNLRNWIEAFWRPRYVDDPMGLIFIEVDPIGNKNGAYPTYKSSQEIFDALPNGRRLEYVIFKTKDPAIFRVVDDARDVMVKLTGQGDQATVTDLKGKEYPAFINWFDQVPALIVSDISRDGDFMAFASPIQDELELAHRYLTDGSIANIYRFKNGFPIPWKYPEVCGKCKGTKAVGGQACDDCNGSGIKIQSKPGDISVFAWPTKDEPEISDKGGYISPALDYLKYADESQALLEELITRTHWGTDRETKAKTQDETATGRFIDTQPVINRLVKYAKAAESIEEFITDQIAYYKFTTGWKGASVSLGRRFLIEPADAVWKKYEDARSKGAGSGPLNDLLRDYYETKFQANANELQKYLKLMDLEPGVHLTIGEAKANLPYIEYMKKVYFAEFVSGFVDMEIINIKLKQLRADLETFTKEKIASLIPDPMAPAPVAGPGGEGAGAAGGSKGGGPGRGNPKPEPANANQD
jgi:hypothetical protein